MSKNTSTLYGSVPLKVWDKEIVSLTWSATLTELWWYKILTDLWLFQWWEGSDYFNKKNIEFLLENDIDCTVITHPHIDHVWRLPLLYKYGFRKAIYMTNSSKDITKLMLLDSLKIQEEELEERLRINNKLWFRLRQALKIKNYLQKLKNNNFSDKEEKQKIDNFLKDILWENYNTKQIIKEINDYLDFYKVETENDIKKVINELNEMLFNEEDIEWVMSLIQTIDYSEEHIISNKKIQARNKNLKGQEILENLPEKIANWFNEKISVDSRSDKRRFRKIWMQKYQENISKIMEENPDFSEKKEEFKKQFEAAFTFCEQYSFLKDIDKKQLTEYKNDETFEEIIKNFENHEKFLQKYWIKKREDINKIIENNEIIIDIFKIWIPYSKDDIKKASNFLQISNNWSWLRQVVWSIFTNAKHVVWSASVFLTMWEIKSKVKNIFNINWKAFSVFLTWDLGRYNDEDINRLGKPELAPHPVDFLQIETTYWWREHREKEESVNDLIESIKSWRWDVLISCFAQQRLQEILMTLLEEIQKDKKLFTNEDENQFLNREIIVDAPLGANLIKLYIKHEWEIFELLDEKVQEKIFGKVMVRFLEIWEWEDIYKYYDWPKQYIILSSSWMMDWWAIMNHLQMILKDKEAKILAPWYLCKWTIWHQIVTEWKNYVVFNKQAHNVECESKFINGFSSHISHSEILLYIVESIKTWKLKLDSTIALNHGDIEWQKKLKEDIETILKELDRTDIKVVIPGLFEEYDITKRKTIGNKKEQYIKKIDPRLMWEKVVTPSFLLSESKLKQYEDTETEEEKKLREKKLENKSKIKSFQQKCSIWFWKLRKFKNNFSKDFLQTSLKPFLDNLLFTQLWQISNLWEKQQKEFFTIIDKKIENRKKLKSSISSMKWKIKNINTIYSLIEEFKSKIDETYPIECDEIQSKINDLDFEINQLTFELQNTNDYEETKLINQKINSKRNKLNSLKNKYSNFKFLISWDASDLKQEIKNLFSSINNINKEIDNIKQKDKLNKKDSEKIREFNNKKLEKKKKIKHLERKILKIESKRPNFENRLKRNIPENFHKKLQKIFNNLWNSWDEENLLELRELCDNSISDIRSDIVLIKWDIDPHISINLEKKEPYFWWIDLFNVLKNENSSEIDLETLNNFLEINIFSKNDKEYIEIELEKINESDRTKKRWRQVYNKAMKKLSQFFKYRKKFNENLWIDFNISIKELNENILESLSNLFEEDYFENNISPYFDIYLFLKSRESISEYISRKYSLEKLKWFEENFNQYEDYVDDLEDADSYLQRILNANDIVESEEDLENLNSWIEDTIKIVEEVVKKVEEIVK